MVIKDANLDIIATRRSQYPIDNKPEFLLVGRSNVGKSSFINTILSKKNLAHTSSKPGKTQTLNFYGVNNSFYLIDVPGYGYAITSKENRKKFGMMIEEYLETREELKRVFMIIDFRHKPTEDDLLMFNFIKFYKLGVTIVATKYDKVNMSSRTKCEKAISDAFTLQNNDNIIYFSSITKKGKEEVYELIENSVNMEV
jgi:GTP-binding protein